ncbi:MAG: HEPN domain-containing protein [Synergistaceae bacterium]|jgi:uncharacterized protein (UPF0332 family)|nr:HEPN domain-containing protein [Synergistaceae bacterium]
MLDEKRSELAAERLKRAVNNLEDAKLLLDNNRYNSSTTRAYFAIFNSLRAVLAMDGVDFKKHSGVISYFQRNYVKTGLFVNEISDYIRDAFTVRNDSDYQDFYFVSEEDARMQINNAAIVIETVKKYLSSGNKSDDE